MWHAMTGLILLVLPFSQPAEAIATPVAAASAEEAARPLSFTQRIEAQRAIEDVYWSRRTWPSENATPKPPLSVVMSEEALAAKVIDQLKMSNALEKWWQRPLTGKQLQAELQRMASSTRSPEALRELFVALGNDWRLIAETLARQTLAERLLRDWYALDERFHGDTRSEAQAALERLSTAGGGAYLSATGGEYREVVWVREARALGSDPRHVPLGDEEWRRLVDRLASRLSTAGPRESAGPVPRSDLSHAEKRAALPVGVISALEETHDRFEAFQILAKSGDEMTAAFVTWPKAGFEEWWSERRAEVDAAVVEPVFDYSPVTIAGTEIAASDLLGGCVAEGWTATLTDVPDPRHTHTAVWTGTEMIVWGGWSWAFPVDTGGRFNPATNTWTSTSTGANAPSPRQRHTAVWTGTEMIVWGGSEDTRFDTGGRYDPLTDTWTEVSTGANVPAPRDGHTAVWTGSEMIVWGGWNGGYMNTGGRYDPATDSWASTSIGANVPGPRNLHAAVWTGSEMIVWGGWNGTLYLDTGGRYDPATDAWSAVSTGVNAPSPRTQHRAAWTGSEMLVWGGWSGAAYLGTGARYDPASDTWAAISSAGAPSARGFPLAVFTGAEWIVWGGTDGAALGTGGRYDPTTDAWTAISTSAAPSPRAGHRGVWTGSELILWGGTQDGFRVKLSGGRYDPATDSWIATPIETDVPSPRLFHTAVWTGAEMIVWGGGFDSDPIDDGGRYDPATDSWTPTSMTAAPSARAGHAAVWSGTEMIVWGGSTASGGAYLDSGGRYDPATDSWAPTSLGANVPSARWLASAIWTGAEMIVWGGENGSLSFNSGGRYDPSADTWTATSIVGPAARHDHTAIWTGAEMVVWGGREGSVYFNDGGRYDPSTDAWTPISVFGANVPSRRHRHTAVWTGNEMIVWGGREGSTRLATGGRYAFSTNSWTPTSVGANVPEARSLHSAVWTGSEMVVWGGESISAFLNSGGRYDPSTDTWTPTSTGDGVPTKRNHRATAVWTGSEMIVWGANLSSGGRYAPGNDGAACDDGDACTTSDACAAGACAGGPPPPPPGEIAALSATTGTTFVWDSLPGATYDAVRGTLGLWPTGGAAGQSCVKSDEPGASLVDVLAPVIDSGFWYLARGRDACGGIGTYGASSTGAPRVSTACP